LFFYEVLDEIWGASWIEPELNLLLEVYHWRRKSINDGAVSSLELDGAVWFPSTLMHFILFLLIGACEDSEFESHSVVRIQGLFWNPKQIMDGWESIN
jgi:hypothetical protein